MRYHISNTPSSNGLITLLLILGFCLISGCASSGPKFTEISQLISEPNPGWGRIYFYRERSILGAAIQPDIRVNIETVGSSTPGGFFFIDRQPGTYTVSMTTEVENKIELSLESGQILFVKTYVGMGLIAGRAYPEQVDRNEALIAMSDLYYTGKLPLQPASQSKQVQSPSETPSAIKMDDLRGLLPPAKSKQAQSPSETPSAIKMDDLKNLLAPAKN